jgi:spermidine synthase
MIGGRRAAALVFGSSAAVLVVEIVALRLLAPYYGLTLETSTLVIGIALAAIALGAWAGGRAADRWPPYPLLAPLLGVSGIAAGLTPFLVRGAAATGDTSWLFLTAVLSIMVPASLLSAVTPVVIKLQLSDLGETGSVVGRLSGIGSVGAIAGTVVTGFVLISRLPVSGILVGLGLVLVLAAAALHVQARNWKAAARGLVLVVVGGLGALLVPSGCDAETTYHCLAIEEDPDRDGGRLLLLDGVQHSYVDLDDPTYLELDYAQAAASAIDTAFPAGQPLRSYHLGGGGLTLPRYLEATRPGTTSRVSEIDDGVVRVDRSELGMREGPRLDVRVEDGRLGIRTLRDGGYDLVVGDAFGGVSVPWHLTTREALAGIDRALTDDGVYVANLIDRGPLAFARAKVATVTDRFAHVALLAAPGVLAREDGGNLVVVASQRPLDVASITDRIDERGTGWRALTGDELTGWVGEAPVLTDDFAPVDQYLTPYPER